MIKEKKTYFLGGVPLKDIVQNYPLPFFLYDAQQIIDQINKLKSAFPGEDVKIKYAMKALSNINILKLMYREGIGVDTVSIEEVLLALQAGYLAKDIVYTPSNVSFQEIQQAIQLQVNINVDSLSLLEKIGIHYPEKEIFIRFNPDIIAGGNKKIQVGHKKSKFGIYWLNADKVLEEVKKYRLNVKGLHIHTGSDIQDITAFTQAAERLIDIALKFDNIEYLNFGGGFKIGYKKEEKDMDIHLLADKITLLLKKKYSQRKIIPQLFFEPGRFLVSKAGFLITKVNVIKKIGNTLFACIDTGFNHFLRPMMYDAYHHIINVSNPDGVEKKYDVVGYICEKDTFAKQRMIAEIRENDILCIYNVGAYGFSMSSNYNMRRLPAEVLLYKNKSFLIRKEQKFEQLLENQVEIEL